MNVLLAAVCTVLGLIVGWIAAIVIISNAYIGTLRLIFVNDHLERSSLEFENKKAMDKAQHNKYALVDTKRIDITDPDA